jgi:hypothetical protein
MNNFFNLSRASSLSAQIRATERRVASRQRQIRIHAGIVSHKIESQLTTPTNLLLASGMGFIIGELTKNNQTVCGNGKDRATTTSPLKIALNLFSSIRTVYAALPLVLVVTSAFETKAAQTATTPGWQVDPAAPQATTGKGSR